MTAPPQPDVPPRNRWLSPIFAKYVIRVPRRTTLENVASSNGSLRTSNGTNASVHAATSSTGSVRSDFEIIMRGALSRHRIEGTIGSGGAKIDLTTSNGSIRLVKI